MTQKGVKFDSQKDRWELLPIREIHGIVKVLTYGASKYTDDGWQEVPNAKKRYLAAMYRHLFASLCGERLDQESGLPHLDHALTNLLFLCYFDNQEMKETTDEQLLQMLRDQDMRQL